MLLFGNLDFDPQTDSIDCPGAFPPALMLEGTAKEDEGEDQEEHGSRAQDVRPKPKREEKL